MIGPEKDGAYGNLGNAYFSLGKFQKALEYHEKHLKIAIAIGDRAGQGRAYGSLGNAYNSLGAFRKAIEYHEKCLKIGIEIGDRAHDCLLYTSPSPRDLSTSRMPSSA